MPYPPPDPIGGRLWCVELRRRLTGLIGPDLVPPHWAPTWPRLPGMYNPRTTGGRPYDRTANRWPPGNPSNHAWCDGDDLMITHLGHDRGLEVLQQVAWCAVVMMLRYDPIEPAGEQQPGYITEVIANRTRWTITHPAGRRYSGTNPHTDHVHISISRPGSPGSWYDAIHATATVLRAA